MVNTFEGLLALLVENNVVFAVVGGVAVCLNGFVRTTDDLDILVEDSPSNIRKLRLFVLQSFHLLLQHGDPHGDVKPVQPVLAIRMQIRL